MDNCTTIIVADDHPISRKGLIEIISEDKSYKIVAEAGDGEAALLLIKKLEPHIAVLDINMPKLNGFDIVHALKELKSKTKIVFLTLHKEEEILKRALDIGVLGYVIKESALEDILECIKTVLDNKHYVSPQLSEFLINSLGRSESETTLSLLGKLSSSERTILKLIAEKKSSQEIADQLFISIRTVDNHRMNICKKLNLRGVNSLLKFALENKSLI